MEGFSSNSKEDCVRPQFGSRFLTDKEKVFEHNAWDNVDWDPEMIEAAKEKIAKNSTQCLDKEKQEEFENGAAEFWNEFYNQHQNKFFKDRHWLFTEFPELLSKASKKEDDENGVTNPNFEEKIRMLEVGCGVGNTVFPILLTNNDSNLFVYCCDFAESAIEIVKQHSLYDPARCHAFVCDVASDDAQFPCSPGSIDVISLIFVLSAIHPEKMLKTIERLSKLLKPGGVLLFRDYGLYDMAQLRFKSGRCLSENFYVRGDGTRVYFFTQEEVDEMFTKCGLEKEQNYVDKRLQVNRGKQLKMYRVWIQCKYRKWVPFK